MGALRKELITSDSLSKVLREAGLTEGKDTLVKIKENQVLIYKNPVESMWGTLKSEKDALDLKREAYEAVEELMDEKMAE